MKRNRTQRKMAAVTSLGSRLGPVVSAQIGRLIGVDPRGRLLVEVGERGDGIPAVTAMVAPRAVLEQAAANRQEVVLLFDQGDPLRPIVVGFVAPVAPGPQGDKALELVVDGLPDVAQVDGKRVCIEGKDEVVLKCGEASITLRRNGRVVIKGAYVESHSKGTNRIKGGTVQIN